MIEQLEVLFYPVHELIDGQPILFVLLSGFVPTLGSVLGEILMYWAARLGGRSTAERMAKWFRINTRHIDWTESVFQRWGVILVIFGRILPGVRTMVSVPAGITRMNFALFFGASFSGAYVWNTLLVGVSYLLGFSLLPSSFMQ